MLMYSEDVDILTSRPDIIREIRIDPQMTYVLTSLINKEKEEQEKKIDRIPLIISDKIETDKFFTVLKQEQYSGLLLPRNCRFLKRISSRYTVAIVEDEPQIRTIRVNADLSHITAYYEKTQQADLYEVKKYLNRDSDGNYTFRLAFPYMIYLLLLNQVDQLLSNMYVFWRRYPLNNLDDILQLSSLTNVYLEGRVCLHNTVRFKENEIIKSIKDCLETFWGSPFNFDIQASGCYVKNGSLDSRLRDYFSWAYHTEHNPEFILSANLGSCEKTIPDIIRDFSRDDQSKNPFGILTRSAVPQRSNIKADFLSRLLNAWDTNREEYVLGNRLFSVGDRLSMNGKNFYIVGFYSEIEGNSSVDYIGLEREDGKRTFLRSDKKRLQSILLKSLESGKQTEKTKEGQEVRIGDFLELSFPFRCMKVVKRFSRNHLGELEALLNSDWYILDNTKFKIIDPSFFFINGKPLDRKSKYVVYDDRNSMYVEAKFTGFSNQETQINATFSYEESDRYGRSDRREIKINLSNNFSSLICDMNDIEKIQNCFLSFHHLFETVNSFKNKRTGVIYPGQKQSTQKQVLPKLLADGKLSINTTEQKQIQFEPGDKVIIPDWSRPSEYFNIKQIKEIKVDKELRFVFTDETSFLYSRSSNLYGDSNVYIKIGSVRKVVEEFNGLKVGDYLEAKRGFIPCFPKKKPVQIKAIVTDCFNGIPLILCSNYCTLLPNQLNDFEHIAYDSNPESRYAKIKLEEQNLGKIPIQTGDMFGMSSDSIARYMSLKIDKRLRMISINAMTVYDSIEPYPTKRSNTIRFGVLSPRISPKDNISTFQNKVFTLHNSLSNKIFNNPYCKTEAIIHTEAVTNV